MRRYTPFAEVLQTQPVRDHQLLPPFSELKQAVSRNVRVLANAALGRDPLLSSVPHQRAFEGDAMGVMSTKKRGRVRDQKYTDFTVKLNVDVEKLRVLGLPYAIELTRSAVTSQISQQHQHFYKQMDLASLGGSGASVKVDLLAGPAAFLDAMEKLEFSFDSAGEISDMEGVAHPDARPRIEALLRSVMSDPLLGPRWEELRRRKLEEFRAREGNRKLVD